MQTSESIKEISAAMFKAQTEIDGAKKQATNPHLKSKYADLSSVWQAIDKAVTANGLLIIQGGEFQEPYWVLKTRIVHTSGEWFESTTPLLNPKGDMQGLGSAMTYARRYALSSMLGVCPEDDDGEGAKASKPQALKAVQDTVPVKPAAQIAPPDPIIAETKTARLALTNVFKASGLTQDQFKKLTGLQGIQTATLDECKKAIELLQNLPTAA